ncbi:MAG: SLBB domain-containing protein, partial [Alphaproteobacteria bacterium]
VVRGDDYYWFDLYDILLGRVPSRELTLRDGDRILVPPLGATVAVGGKVRRPGIYELAEGEAEAEFDDLLVFAGGPLRPVGNRVLTLSMDPTGRQQVREAPQGQAGTVRDGDIAVVQFGDDVQVGSVFLEGHVRLPGRRSLASATTVRALIPDVLTLGETPYLLFAVLRTHEPYTYSPVFVPIDLQRVLSGVQDMPLKAEDRLIVFGLEDVRYLWSMEVQAVLAGGDVFDRLLSLVGGAGGVSGLPGSAGDVEAGQVSSAGIAAAPVTVAAAESASALAASGGLADVLKGVGQIGQLCDGLFVLHNVVSTSQPGRFPNALLVGVRDLEPIITPREPCPKIYDRYPDLLPFVLEHLALLKGEVRIPGVYPVAPNTPLNTVVAYAGGTGLRVDLTKTEIMRDVFDAGNGVSQSVRETVDLSTGGAERVFVAPGDVILFASRFSDRDEKPILLVGEFLRPGLYEVRRGERLSEVVARAGGLTPQAYPYGAVFTRERTKQSEKVAFERAARELEIALAEALTQRTTGLQSATGAEALRALADQLRQAEPVGRVVIEADPTVLQVRPELDTVLEGGDRLFMPKRPNSVTVIGDVLNESTLQFVPGARVDEYIDKAGGLRRSADDGRIFVVLPNGEAQPVSVSAWNYTPVAVPPGSTIVVPKEPAPFDAFAFIKDITQVTSQLAITAAAIAAINRR